MRKFKWLAVIVPLVTILTAPAYALDKNEIDEVLKKSYTAAQQEEKPVDGHTCCKDPTTNQIVCIADYCNHPIDQLEKDEKLLQEFIGGSNGGN